MKMRKFGHFLIFVAVVGVAVAAIMLLWNVLIPSIIGWSAINFWQAAGLLVLCKLLFGGFGHHWKHHWHGHYGHHGHCGKHGREEFRHFHEAMKGMSRDERREYIRERMSHGFDGESNHPHNREE